MAGAGYKLFNTGDVLTAAQVNTYLQEQVVMVFADAAARTTALSGVLAEGMVSYLKSTKVVEIYNGTAWASLDDPNAIQNTIVDAKGDLITATAADTPARLAVGSNGDTLVADSAASVGLRWQGNYSAGKNKIINGDFNVNQRLFTSTTTTATYGFDRWRMDCSGGTSTYSAQTFTAGAAPVAGYESTNYARIVTSGQSAAGDLSILYQKIEDVRTFAGQTITISFWAQAGSGTPKIGIEVLQDFGSGGSPSAPVSAPAGSVTLSTSWARYSVTVAVPSISGKTIGTTANTSNLQILLWVSAGTTYNTRASSIGAQNATFNIWGVQAEAGSVATAFQTATGTLQGELAACQRYYERFTSGATYGLLGTGKGGSAGVLQINMPFRVQKRVAPTAIDTAAMATFQYETGGTAGNTPTTIVINPFLTTDAFGAIDVNKTSSFTTGSYYYLMGNNNTAAYVGFSAEL